MSDEDKILVDDALKSVSRALARNEPLAAFESAGPRRKNFFDPAKACCAIVNCGGLCPGLNDVIRALCCKRMIATAFVRSTVSAAATKASLRCTDTRP